MNYFGFLLIPVFLLLVAEGIEVVQEQPCEDKFGYCAKDSDCPYISYEEERALCPNQRENGVVCCGPRLESYGKDRCKGVIGDCLKNGEGSGILQPNVTDCKPGHSCFILI